MSHSSLSAASSLWFLFHFRNFYEQRENAGSWRNADGIVQSWNCTPRNPWNDRDSSRLMKETPSQIPSCTFLWLENSSTTKDTKVHEGSASERIAVLTMGESIAEFFLEHFRAHGQECAYAQRRGYRTEKVTYAQVMDRAFGFAQDLERRAIGRGDRILLWGENSAEWAAVFFGCALRGVVVVPMDDGASADFARRVCGQVGAKLVVTSSAHREAVADLAVPILGLDDLPEARQEVVTSSGSDMPGRDDILQIVFTSGTTADPKGVVITHGNVLANIAPLENEIRAYLKYERLVHPVRFLNLLPLSHVFGQFLGMFLPPLLGGTVIFQDELKPSEVVNTIRRERVSVLVSVPRVLQSLKQKVERDIEDSGQAEKFRQRFQSCEGQAFSAALVDFPRDPPAVRLEVLGVHFRRRRARQRHRRILGPAGIRRDSRLWTHGDDVADQRESSLPAGQGIDREGSAGPRGEAGRRRRDSRARGRCGVRILGLGRGSHERFRRARLVSHGRHRRARRGRQSLLQGTQERSHRHAGRDECVSRRSGGGAAPAAGGERLRGGGNRARGKCRAVRGGDPARVRSRRSSWNRWCGGRIESLAEFQRMRMWVQWPQEDFPRTNTQKPQRSVIRDVAQAQMLQSPDSRQLGSRCREPSVGRFDLRVSRAAPCRVLSENASLDSDLGLSSLDRVELLERYRRSLSSRPERNAIQLGADRRRSGTHAARRSRARQRRITIPDGRCAGR